MILFVPRMFGHVLINVLDIFHFLSDVCGKLKAFAHKITSSLLQPAAPFPVESMSSTEHMAGS